MADPVTITLVAVALTGTAMTMAAQNSAAKSQKREIALRREQAEAENRRKRIEELRKSRRARATAQAKAVSAGVSDSSGLFGTEASIGSQTASNLNFLDTSNHRASLIADAQSDYISNTQKAQLYGALTDLSTQAAAGMSEK